MISLAPIKGYRSLSAASPAAHPAGGADVFVIASRSGFDVRAEREINTPFLGTVRLTLPPSQNALPTLELFAMNPHRVVRAYDSEADRAIYLWGRAVHSAVRDAEELLRWC